MVRNIRELCKKRGMSLQNLEEELKFGYRTIEQWDDHIPSVNKVNDVAKYFGVSIEELLREGGETKNVGGMV